MTLKKFFTLIAALIIIFLTGCGAEKVESVPDKVFAIIDDDAGRKIYLEKKPERIAVTSASFLEPLHEVGGNIVGRPDSKNNMPDWAKDISSVGHVYQIDVEKLLACTPDLVIINKGMNEKLLDVLEQNKIPALVLDMKTYDDVKREVKIFAQLTENVDAGEKIINGMDAEIKTVLDSTPKKNLRVAILHSTAQGLTVQLDGSIAGCVVKMFGWENVAAGMTPLENNPDAAPYSMETLAAQNPEIIFVTSMGNVNEIKANMEKSIAENSAWQTIGAIKNNRVYYLPQNLFLLSPGLRYPDAVKFIANLIDS
ncbi:MAG: ABC transporter substrate-binding protein [Selenomonadaceae bacterium]|nr:ABC transporter substrate-binding protein [Selenomonadaceae bacterium]